MRQRHVPLRTCVACRKKGPQSDFIRVTRSPDGDFIAGTARESGGRGAYLCKREECFEAGLQRGLLERALKGPGSARSKAALAAVVRADASAGPGVGVESGQGADHKR